MLWINKEEEAPQEKGRREKKSRNKEELGTRKYMGLEENEKPTKIRQGQRETVLSPQGYKMREDRAWFPRQLM